MVSEIQKALALQVAHKYLMLFSYVGTHYHGLQIQTPRKCIHPVVGCVKNSKDKSIQYMLEQGLSTLTPRPLNSIRSLVSSRTDSGVHALLNSCHLFLVHPDAGKVYAPNMITQTVNKWLADNEHSIIVRKTYMVSHGFHCSKNIKWRKYVYRFAVLNPNISDDDTALKYLPITEINRCLLINSPASGTLDWDGMKEACEIFEGVHDFSSFQAKTTDTRNVWKRIEECRLHYIPDINNFDPLYQNIKMFEIHVKGNSFLYKQIKRMVGCILSVGRGSLSTAKIRKMLEAPFAHPWDKCMFLVPAYGLYLKHIEYNEDEFMSYGSPEEHQQILLNLVNTKADSHETKKRFEVNHGEKMLINCFL